jgi:hypothetical protein
MFKDREVALKTGRLRRFPPRPKMSGRLTVAVDSGVRSLWLGCAGVKVT